jgi:aspartate-semialdehyde dehydrogenase
MTRQWKVAVLGATGLVGDTMIKVLEERKFPVAELFPLASNRSLGKSIEFNGKKVPVIDVETFDFANADIGLFSAGGEISRIYAPKAAAAGCVVIDNTSEFRYEEDIPLVVPEVNPEAIAQFKQRRIIANPNCSTIQMLVALKPLHDAAIIKRIVVSTYQSVSGAGKDGMDELFTQSRAIFVGDEPVNEKFTKRIAFNVIPHIDSFLGPDSGMDGYTKEEWKMTVETRKILDPDIEVTATCVRVPVFVGHSEAINVEFEMPLSVAKAQSLLREAPGIMLVDKREDGGYVTPIECVGDYATFVSRVRKDPTVEHGLALWCVSDNLRKGAALNAVQIAELLGRRHLKKG